jgi:uncharacterized sulfatase
MKSLSLLFYLFAFAVLPGSPVSAADKPNILHILVDDMGWTALSCFGNKDIATPNLDRLAAQGMRFTNAYADAQCSPTRGAFFSGQYGARSGMFKVTHEKEPPRAFMIPPPALLDMPPQTASLALMLRKAGYTTGMSGKWHIAGNYSAAAMRDQDEGRYFDRYGFDFVGPASESAHAEDKAVTAITDEILGFIENAGAKPWFAYAAHFTPHTKLSAPKALIEKHAARGYKRTSTPIAKFSERPTAEYLAMLEHLDNEIGRMMARLDALGLAANTLVLFTSDNGGLSRMTSCAPLREGKGAPYEGGIRVPLIVRWPAVVKAGSECATPVHVIDFYPTYAQLAAATLPAEQKLDGASLLPLLQERGDWKRDTLAWHMPTYTTDYGRTPCAVIRRGDWKLIHWFGDYLDPRGATPDDKPYGKLVIGPRTELYDLSNDVSETRDLASSHPEKAADLRAALDAWLKDTGAALPKPNPNFDEANWSQTTNAESPNKNRKSKRPAQD